MRKTPFAWACLAVLIGLGACAERPQEQGSRAAGSPAYKGTGSKFVAPGWTPGDASSWEEQTRSRARYGQNEYSRIAGK